jgi:hypothetical protein
MTYKIKIEQGGNTIEVILDAYIEKDMGIGAYEYWGFREYDSGSGELYVSSIDWDATMYKEDENVLIEKYIDDNWDELNNRITKEVKLCKDY